MLSRLPPSFVGTSAASLFASGYTIFGATTLTLLTTMERITLFGCAALVLLTYSVSGVLLDEMCCTGGGGQPRRLDYLMRAVVQFFLGLALGAVGTHPLLFLIAFALFTATRLLWIAYASPRVRPILWPEIVNGVLFLLFIAVAAKLYLDASAFDAAVSRARDLHERSSQLDQARKSVTDWLLMLGLVSGAILGNLILLLRNHAQISYASEADADGTPS